ncbi:hypothetical protein B9Q09_03830 [Candidatus Marsarchaeota G2 archaeon ECH_B_SAG-C16]|uniref:Uncharacterized protein n=5 Tax=Candidatus Marsarchaeota group 2 TaxID=2203771 RepID=A0A2R6BCB8_9ARCH|nr:MAG: hypothetical protein B9Q08_02860 [Candidatus Marsarchaeota G2 archaeon ECH_B_SAG-M15]PSN94749.1 MAG: hypothetical protein B9Q09_03830 [Candidatus Marsarchaeota G2 archaeon ECH_B_SAG-C16]PSN96290.1 MAG: hypothetical protein B9Q06_02885 [Candidatus Marsarchaeota G2 archaeon ECH_B_2]PSO00950.1 MAG: hypothetical protein B9Q07_02230 [Candidatus Marsarchaeota G2 archaeon ECH_B_3]PSO02867.1 MAG: hypothetical protein B9Q05_03605 [Candidatus Marsarchaeota G2 archaeon ECH_B_1]
MKKALKVWVLVGQLQKVARFRLEGTHPMDNTASASHAWGVFGAMSDHLSGRWVNTTLNRGVGALHVMIMLVVVTRYY